ncbi:MAG: helicase-related protein, partial [Acidimicrobiales bacterium]
MSFAVGSLVRARGREWVVLPDSDDELVLLRPLGGRDSEVAGVLSALEAVEPATFALPDPAKLGDFRSAGLLRDAMRLGFRSSAGPFRSFGTLAFEPRPYQLVPLLMALRLDPVRLLIADDVGTGKTASALMVVAELLAQGDARRLAILCPPHLALQWQAEMHDKFHLEAELVLPSTASRLERGCRVGQSLFDRHDVTVVSTEFIKADRRREEFLQSAPGLIVVDEAHTCAGAGEGRSHHQRHELVAALAADPKRHLLLVTATPHSGKEDAFRSLLALLDPSFAELPEDLGGEANARHRRRLARHFVQRRRADLAAFVDDTPFPDRLEAEETWTLGPEYRALFERSLAWASEVVRDDTGGRHRQRMRWWAALALLRSIASSPAAAAATLARRAQAADTDSAEEADVVGRLTVLDLGDEDDAEPLDVAAGASTDPVEPPLSNLPGAPQPGAHSRPAAEPTAPRAPRRLAELARLAEACMGDADTKLIRMVRIVTELLAQGARPIIFARFIATADYLEAELRRRLGSGVEVVAVSGRVPAAHRAERIAQLATHDRRVLVATDCLSEGINLQEHFDAVLHYDLSWNPTRHEQREGRVDRFGQPRTQVRIVTFYGSDNRVDALVLDVLLRKHRAIRRSLGVSVPVPGDPNALIEALVGGLLAQGGSLAGQGTLDIFTPEEEKVLTDWDVAADRERRSRTMFAQEPIHTEVVAEELAEVRTAIGTAADVSRFVIDTVSAFGGKCRPSSQRPEAPVCIHLGNDRALRDVAAEALGDKTELNARFSGTPIEGETLLTRGHPFVAALAAHTLDLALDDLADGPARRAGAMRTSAVERVTTLILVRFRFDLHHSSKAASTALLAEDAGVLAFVGDPHQPEWLSQVEAEDLLHAEPSGNVNAAQATEFVGAVLDAALSWRPGLDQEAGRRAGALLALHRRVRASLRQPVGAYRVDARLPPDVLGTYVLLPGP